MITLVEFMIIASADNRPPMLDKTMYDSWKSRIELYIENKENGRMILNSDENGPLIWPTVEENGETRKRSMKNSQLQKSSKLIVILKLPTFLQPEWSKFVMDVKLDRDLHTTNYDQLYSYLQQHKAHANETRLLRERYQDPLALVANYNQTPSHLNNYHSQYTSPHHLTSSIPPSHQYESQMSHQTSSVPQNLFHSPLISTQPMTEFPQLDSGLVVLVFNLRDDPIACLNKAMAFMPLFKMAESLCNKFKGGKYKVMLVQEIREMLQVQGQTMQVDWQGLLNAIIVKVKDTWLAHESNQILDEEQLAFLADPGITDCHNVQPTIIHNASYQTDDLDAYDVTSPNWVAAE
ncbi:hypothetical protein Tco_0438566 [Tanacetum coccineum]